jgi:hypothetical protein
MGEASVAYDDPGFRLAGPTYKPIFDPFFLLVFETWTENVPKNPPNFQK